MRSRFVLLSVCWILEHMFIGSCVSILSGEYWSAFAFCGSVADDCDILEYEEPTIFWNLHLIHSAL
jgi:hypothetical protein